MILDPVVEEWRSTAWDELTDEAADGDREASERFADAATAFAGASGGDRLYADELDLDLVEAYWVLREQLTALVASLGRCP